MSYLYFVACSGGDSERSHNNERDSDSDNHFDSDIDGNEPVDCNALPSLPITDYNILDVSGCENFTFDNKGHLVCVTTNSDNLIYISYPDSEEIIYPSITGGTSSGFLSITARSMRYLPDGETLVYADRINSALMKLNVSTLVQIPLVSGINEPNGLAVDMNGIIYMTNLADTGNGMNNKGPGNVRRVDPDTGETTLLYTADSTTIDGITLSPDHRILYFSSEEGTLYRLPLNADGTAAGPAEVLATIQGISDELTSDACGNIYMLTMNGPIYRITPDGSVALAVTVSNNKFTVINAMNFGSGLGGWRSNAIYIVSMNGGVFEVPMGVGRIPQPHLDTNLCPSNSRTITCLPEAECIHQGGTSDTRFTCKESTSVCCAWPMPSPCPVDGTLVDCLFPADCAAQGGSADTALICKDTTMTCCMLPDLDSQNPCPTDIRTCLPAAECPEAYIDPAYDCSGENVCCAVTYKTRGRT